MNEDNQFSMADVYIMLSVNSVVHSLIFWYMDALLPGDFGMPKPVYFPFTVVTFSVFSAVADTGVVWSGIWGCTLPENCLYFTVQVVREGQTMLILSIKTWLDGHVRAIFGSSSLRNKK